MKCSTVSASEIGKQVTSLQQLDTKMPKSQRRARNHVSGKKCNDQERNYLVWEKIIFLIIISASILWNHLSSHCFICNMVSCGFNPIWIPLTSRGRFLLFNLCWCSNSTCIFVHVKGKFLETKNYPHLACNIPLTPDDKIAETFFSILH